MLSTHKIALGFILLLAIFFRFWNITTVPPGLFPDEAMNGSNALQALESSDFHTYYIDNNGREGLFINLQAIAVWFFGTEAWVLRIVSAVFGTLAVLGLYFLVKELFQNSLNYESGIMNRGGKIKNHNSYFNIHNSEIIALLATFFLATSYWHINFSRIGFRAITTPFFSIFAFYFLLKGMRRGSPWDFVFSGIAFGLGLNGYIAFRFIPFACAVPVFMGLWRWWKNRPLRETETNTSYPSCFPCNIVLLGIVILVVCAPLIMYFGAHPEDFVARTGQVSVFTDEHPIRAFVVSNIKTIGMLFVFGDCNPRHNFPCFPALHPLVSIAFIYGLYRIVISLRNRPLPLTHITLLFWLFFLMLPATLTREGIPHALRSIGIIPPVMAIAGFGAFLLLEKITSVWKPVAARMLVLVLLASIAGTTGYLYFDIWGNAPSTVSAFSTDLTQLAYYIRSLPNQTIKYLIVDLDYEALPVSAQSVVFLTDTATSASREEKNVHYIPRLDTLRHIILNDKPVIISFIAFQDKQLEQSITQTFPALQKETRGGFPVFIYNP